MLEAIHQRNKVQCSKGLFAQLCITTPHHIVTALLHLNATMPQFNGFTACRLPFAQALEYRPERAWLTRVGYPVALMRLARVQAVVEASIELDNFHVALNRRNRRQETLTVEAIGIKLIWCLIGSTHQHHAVTE